MTTATQDPAIDGVTENEFARPASPFMRPVEFIAAMLMLSVIALLLTGVISRYVVNLPIIWIEEAASIAFIWLAMLGSAIAIDRNEHLRLTLFLQFLSPRIRAVTEATALVAAAAFLIALIPVAFEYTYEESFITSAALHIPNSWRVAAIPTGFVLMLALLALHAIRECRIADLLIGVLIVAAATGILWAASPLFIAIGNLSLGIFLVLLVAVCLVAGVPIAFCFGIGTLSYLAFATHVPPFVMVGRMDEGMSGVILLSVPVFVMLGCVLDQTGMGKVIIDFLGSILGHVKAGMSYVLLTSLFIVSGISGSKVSDMATVAPALFPEMKRRGNKPPEMIAQLATGAAMADTVPPSIVLIVLGSVAGISIADLFASGFVVALVLLLSLMALARFRARHESMDGVKRANLKTVGQLLVIAAPALILPFIIRGSVTSGIATATEVSTIAVIYGLVIGAILYGGITYSQIYRMLVETAAMSGAILLILGTALSMAWAITQAGVGEVLAQFAVSMPGGAISFIVLSIAIFLVLGCVLEGLPALVLMSPLMFPIAADLGIHAVHYAMIIVVAMNIGLMAPPLGIGFYLACRIGNVAPDSAIRAVWPYIGALLIGLAIISAVPWISLSVI
ncbi:TRAP transporter large permease subunit [Paracoccus onubensis]|uniref:TRAP transporter large permease n=1 Tax=Paracoccus onubensis TaxID=1675788 RepID=UPI00272F6820|nr:TRAP transporter large permease subunit [Paracoccus onubensis]MDP0929442.1 TRAP transporter large permease subunit [Paracoccus onubensis]